MKNAIILLSGGLDSATVGAVARREGFAVNALSFDYGQRHRFELECAAAVAAALGAARHHTTRIDLQAFGGSALTDASIDVPMSASAADIRTDRIPITYVPARNTIFLSFALGWAEVLEADDIYIGVNALDYSGYPDCRPEYIASFERMANLATRRGVERGNRLRIHTPLIDMTKAQTIRLGLELGMDYALTHSCYSPDAEGRACGHCDACLLRLRGFAEVGLRDPARYVAERTTRRD